MLKLLHVIPSIAPKSGGPAGAVISYANLSSTFAEVTILTTREDIEQLSEKELRSQTGLSDEVNLQVCDYIGRHSAKFSKEMLHWLNLNLTTFDIVHLHAAFSVMTTLSARKCQKFGVPYVFRPLGTLTGYSLGIGHSRLKQVYWWLLESKTVSNARRIHVTSPAEKNAVAELIDHNRISTIPIPLTPPEESELTANNSLYSFPSDSLKFGFLSRIHPKKNLESVFEAFAREGMNKKWHLNIAGSGEQSYINQLQKRANDLGISEHISWEGFLSGEAKTRFFQSVDFFLLPSFDENFGIAAGEALSHGIPAILSDQVDIGSWGGPESGVIICNTDTESIREALSEAGSWSGDTRLQRGRNARKMITQHFNPENLTHQLRELYSTM